MAGLDRVIDPVTKDYVSDGNGGRLKTRTARTAIYHQLITRLGQWWGDPTAGSGFFELARSVSTLQTPRVIEDVTTQALKRLVDLGRITAPVFETERVGDRVNHSVTVTDIQSGETLKLTSLLPFVP